MKLSELPLQDEFSVLTDADIQSFALIDEVTLQNALTYIESTKYLNQLYQNRSIAAVCASAEVAEAIDCEKYVRGIIRANESPKKLFYKLHNQLVWRGDFYKAFSAPTFIADSAQISEFAHIASHGVKIGERTVIDAGAVIMPGSTIGEDCFVGANTTIGGRGFQYYRDTEEVFYIEHIGGVNIGDRVEVFSNSCIASGLFTPTTIGNDTKIDNLVHIAHSDKIGERCFIPAGVTLGGSVTVEDDAWIGMGACVKQKIHVGNHAIVSLGAGVYHNIGDYEIRAGNPDKVIGRSIIREDGSQGHELYIHQKQT